MDLNLGSVIKRLRTEQSIKQDELFSVDHEDELERIDTMLQKENMTDQNYAYAKRVLDGILRENPKDAGAMKRYAKVYLAKTNTDLIAAGRMLESAMELAPLDEEVYGLYRMLIEAMISGKYFDRAIECFEHAYEAQTAPHKMDMMYSVAFLYKKPFARFPLLFHAIRNIMKLCFTVKFG